MPIAVELLKPSNTSIAGTIGTATDAFTLASIVGPAYTVPFTIPWVIASTTILAVFFIFGVSANLLTIVVIRSSKRLDNRYYTFIMSMCVSDILSAFASILFLYRRTWGFVYFAWPEFFCKLYWGLDLWTSFATALHILSFAVLRLIGVRWTTVFRQITSRYMAVWIFSIWFVTFTAGFIPHYIFNNVKPESRLKNPAHARWASCSLDPKWVPTWQVYVQIVYALFIFAPAIAIITISLAIAVMLKRRKRPGCNRHQKKVLNAISKAVFDSNETMTSAGEHQFHTTTTTKKRGRSSAEMIRYRRDRQAIVQLWLIVGSFLFGYIPLTAYHNYTGFTINESNNEINAFDWRFAMVQYIMLRFSECLNPIFYNLASKKMRTETKRVLCRLLRKRSTAPTYRRGSSAQPSSNI